MQTNTGIDAEEGALLLLPANVVVDTSILMPLQELTLGKLFRTVKTGITRVVVPGSNWATYVRVARRQYVGLATYRHLEDTIDD